jgi:hypothetical protein
MFTKDKTKNKQTVARILVHSNPLLSKEVQLRQNANPLLGATDIVYQLVGERLAQIANEQRQFIETRKILIEQIKKGFTKMKPREKILKMSDEELDEYVEANY